MSKKWTPKGQPWIVCAANRYGDLIVLGARHHDRLMNEAIKQAGSIEYVHTLHKLGQRMEEQGFVDQFGQFYQREEAMLLAIANGQLQEQRDGKDCEYLAGTILYSEDLY